MPHTTTIVAQTGGKTFVEVLIPRVKTGPEGGLFTVTSTSTVTQIGIGGSSSSAILRTSTSAISTSSRGNNSSGAANAPHVHQEPASSGSLSTGAKAGIGVGVAIAAIVLFGFLLLFCRRKRRAKDVPEISGDEANNAEKKVEASQGAGAKGHVLPTWKSELSGDSYRAELDAANEKKRAEVSSAKSPTELDAAAFNPVEKREVPQGAKLRDSPEEGVRQDDEIRQENETQQEGTIDLSNPPPIPYASKPRPS